MLGNLKYLFFYLVILLNYIDLFVIKLGEIKLFMLFYEVDYELVFDYDEELNKYILVSLEVILVNGKCF